MDASTKLKRDLVILEAMAAEMDEYLRSEVLFWPLRRGDLPRLTVGGYLMRQHRLRHLRDLLEEEEQERLKAATSLFVAALEEKVVRFENKIHEELSARLRQWRAYLQDLKQGKGFDYYETAVEPRVMVDALMAQLRTAPYRLRSDVPRQVIQLDRILKRRWEAGPFVWPEAWEAAYPEEHFWWLYGRPRRPDA